MREQYALVETRQEQSRDHPLEHDHRARRHVLTGQLADLARQHGRGEEEEVAQAHPAVEERDAEPLVEEVDGEDERRLGGGGGEGAEPDGGLEDGDRLEGGVGGERRGGEVAVVEGVGHGGEVHGAGALLRDAGEADAEVGEAAPDLDKEKKGEMRKSAVVFVIECLAKLSSLLFCK